MRILAILFFIIVYCVKLFPQESGEIIISEILYNAASSETTHQTQFIEIANTTPNPISLNGWTIDDEDNDGPNVLPNITLPAYGIAVICGSSETDFINAFGSGFTVISTLDLGQTMFNLANSPSDSNEIIQLRDNLSNLVDEVNFDDASPWPSDSPQGASIFLNIPKNQMSASNNNDGNNWARSVNGENGSYTSSAYGIWNGVEITSAGNIFGDTALPVDLSLFQAKGMDNFVILSWVTQSEINNLGFTILRSKVENGNYEIISSYQNNSQLIGNNNSNTSHNYSFSDNMVENNITYFYKLQDACINGNISEHGPVNAMPHKIETEVNTKQEKFTLHSAFPNPFNPTTKMDYFLAEGCRLNISVFSIQGKLVDVIVHGWLEKGPHNLQWTPNNKPSGIYFIKFSSKKFNKTQKIIYLK